MAYYYLMSSLPMLFADGEAPISYEEFLASCKGNVSEGKYTLLENLSVSSDEGPFLSQWAAFYKAFNQELCYQRNQRLGKKGVLPEYRDAEASKVIASAMNNENPLEAEKILLSLEFKRLDELLGVHGFDDYALLGYALKLKLLERKKVFKQDSGKREFKRIIEGLEEQILGLEQE